MFEKINDKKQILKLTKSLHNAKSRDECKLFLVEGAKCCTELLNSNYVAKYLIINKDNCNDYILSLARKFAKKSVNVYEFENSIFQKLADTVSPQAILAVAQMQESTSQISPNYPLAILDNIADPGNIGTIIRTADWFGIKQIVLVGSCASKYSPKVVRATMGSIFRVNVLEKEVEDIKKIFSAKEFSKVKILAASLDAKITLEEVFVLPNENFCLVVGNESRGISPELEKIITNKFVISGQGNAESLNVAIAFGISLFCLQKK